MTDKQPDRAEQAAEVCESRARSLSRDGDHPAANEARKCAGAIRAALAAPQQAAGVVIDFAQVGTAGPFPVVDGRVSLPETTMQDLVRMLRPTFEAQAPQQEVQEPFGYVNTHTGQFFKDVEACRKNNEGHWRTVYTAQPAPSGEAEDAQRWRTFIGLPYAIRSEWACNLSMAPVLTQWIDTASKEGK